MKKIVNLVEDENEGLVSLIGERVLLMCGNYFYVGTLIGVNESCVKLEDPSIVYETGPWGDDKFKNSESMNVQYHYVSTSHIESFGISSR